jgi:hypothetical protein
LKDRSVLETSERQQPQQDPGCAGADVPAGVESFAGFLAAVGHRVVRTPLAHWYEASRGFFLSLPSHRLLCPSAEDLRQVMRHRPCLGVRFPGPIEGPGKPSYQIVCDDPAYGLEKLSANTRSKVRRGLRRCRVSAVPFAELRVAGRRANDDTLGRQARAARLGPATWDRYWEAAQRSPGMEGWAAYAGGELAAFLVTVRLDDCVEFLLARSRSDRLDLYPNNALIYFVAEEMLVRRGVHRVTFGLESLEPVGPLDQFKFSMGFRAQPLRQRVVFHPLLRALLHPPRVRAWFYRRAERRGAEAAFWRKAAGLLRFAEEGEM